LQDLSLTRTPSLPPFVFCLQFRWSLFSQWFVAASDSASTFSAWAAVSKCTLVPSLGIHPPCVRSTLVPLPRFPATSPCSFGFFPKRAPAPSPPVFFPQSLVVNSFTAYRVPTKGSAAVGKSGLSFPEKAAFPTPLFYFGVFLLVCWSKVLLFLAVPQPPLLSVRTRLFLSSQTVRAEPPLPNPVPVFLFLSLFVLSSCVKAASGPRRLVYAAFRFRCWVLFLPAFFRSFSPFIVPVLEAWCSQSTAVL